MDKVTFSAHGEAATRLANAASLAFGHLGPRIADAAQKGAPILSGDLRRSIGFVERLEGGRPVLYVAAGMRGIAPYAAYVEYGTSRMRAQPYLRPAAFRRWL